MGQNLFTTHVVNINQREFDLFIFGDVHYDTDGCDVERFKRYISNSKKYDQSKCLYLMMGDELDFASASEKRKLAAANLHETTIGLFDRTARGDIKKFCKEIAHMKGKVIGKVGGNHSWVFADGKLSDELIAEEMNTKYLGWLSYIRIRVDFCNKRTYFDIVACHGKAGGKLLGTSINQVDDLRRVFPGADLYIMGHDHKLSSTPAASLYARINEATGQLEIKQLEQRLMRSGSFKKTYSVDSESYEIGRIYPPSILGALRVTLSVHQKATRIGRKKVDQKLIKSIEAHV